MRGQFEEEIHEAIENIPGAGRGGRLPARGLFTGSGVPGARDHRRPAAAPVGAAGAVRRLLRRRGGGLLRGRGAQRHVRAGRSRHHPAGGGLSHGRSRVHDRLGTEGPRGQAWHAAVRPREHRADLPALRHEVGVVEGLEHHESGRLRRQEGWRLGLRQRVRGHGGRPQGRARGRHRLREGHPGLQHGPVAVARRRRRRGDDLQRVRAGARDDQSRHG